MKTCNVCNKDKSENLFLKNLSGDGNNYCRMCFGLARIIYDIKKNSANQVIYKRNTDIEELVATDGELCLEQIIPVIRKCNQCNKIFLSKDDKRICDKCKTEWNSLGHSDFIFKLHL